MLLDIEQQVSRLSQSLDEIISKLTLDQSNNSKYTLESSKIYSASLLNLCEVVENNIQSNLKLVSMYDSLHV